LDFAAYLKCGKINLVNTNTDTWKAVKNGVAICYIKTGADTIPHSKMQAEQKADGLSNGGWVVYPHVSCVEEMPAIDAGGVNIIASIGYEKFISNEKMKSIALSKVRACICCGNKAKCAPGITIIFWGAELTGRCKFVAMPFVNPGREEAECIMALIDIYCRLKCGT